MDAATRRALIRTLRSDGYERRITVTMRDRNERAMDALTAPASRILAGEVSCDVTQDVSRQLRLTLLDPEGKLRFERRSPAQGALSADRFVSVEYGIFVPELDRFVDVNVFWGPITDFDRDGHEVQIEGQGKERLMLAPYLATYGYNVNAGLRVDEAIKRVARRAGERRFNIPRIDRRLAQPRSVNAAAEPWKVINGGARDAKGKRIPGLVERAPGNRYAFYDGSGRLTVKRRNQSPQWVIRDDRELLAPPAVQFDGLDVINTVIVKGRAPDGKGKRRATSGPVSLPEGHSLSPHSLRRHGQPRCATEVVETELKTDAECRERARQILRQRSSQGVEASLRVLPNPLIEPLDMVRLATDEYDFVFPVRYFMLPLTDGAMQIGTRRRVQRRRKKVRNMRFSGGAVIDHSFRGRAA